MPVRIFMQFSVSLFAAEMIKMSPESKVADPSPWSKMECLIVNLVLLGSLVTLVYAVTAQPPFKVSTISQ